MTEAEGGLEVLAPCLRHKPYKVGCRFWGRLAFTCVMDRAQAPGLKCNLGIPYGVRWYGKVEVVGLSIGQG